MDQTPTPSPSAATIAASTAIEPFNFTLLNTVEAVLRNPRQIVAALAGPKSLKLSSALALIATLCATAYGLVVGSFSGENQWWAAPMKIVGGLAVSAFICLPSLYIFSCMSGSRARPGQMIGLLLAMLTLANLLLIGFAPVAWIFSQSTDSTACVGFFHILFWICALLFGCRFISVALRELGSHSTSLIGLWTIIFLLVTLQMTTSLRPFVGTSARLLPEKKIFFLTYWIDGGSEKSNSTHARND